MGGFKIYFSEDTILPYLALITMALLFGLSFVASKYALNFLSPFTLIFLRFFIAFLLLGVLYLRQRQKINPSDRLRLLLTSLIFPGLYFLSETYGLKYAPATTVSLVVSTIPIFTAVLAFFLLNEKLRIWQSSGIILSIIGVAMILISGSERGTEWNLMRWGNFLGLGAAISAALYMTLGRSLLDRYSPLTITTSQAMFAVLIFLPLAGWEQFYNPIRAIDGFTVLAVLYLALFCSVLAFFLWNYGISKLEAGRAAVFTNLVPVFTAFGANMILGERPEWGQIIGGVLVITGVMITNTGK